METVTIASTRSFVLTDFELVALSVVVVGVIAWQVVARVRHVRGR